MRSHRPVRWLKDLLPDVFVSIAFVSIAAATCSCANTAAAQQTRTITIAAAEFPDAGTPDARTADAGTADADLPDAPTPASAAGFDRQTTSSSQSTSSPSTAPTQTAAQTPPGPDDQDRSEQQVRKEKKQRLFGVMPNFNISYDRDAPPLRPGQKFDLAFHTAKDPFTFVISGIDALYSQATDGFGPEFGTVTNSAGKKVTMRYEGYGQGMEGFAKRFGASYLDNFDGTLLGNAVLPVVLKEDPRFFRRGVGTVKKRLLYAMTTTIWCKRDSGTWGPNYANVIGNLAAGGISNLYYPSHDRGLGLTFSRGLTVTAYGTFGGVANEFLPDITRHFLHRDVSGKKVDASALPAAAPAATPAPTPTPAPTLPPAATPVPQP